MVGYNRQLLQNDGALQMKLRKHQLKALDQMKKGCVLCGGTGSGKSLTALSYYYICNGGSRSFLNGGKYQRMTSSPDLYIITTARKRDENDWEREMIPFLPDTYPNKVVVDSWNNLRKYSEVKNAFFIFDEQRVTGKGPWVKNFLRITKNNFWILLSATPGDNWEDYIPLFLANGFYRTRSEFLERHVVFARFCNYPKIEKFINTKVLERYRDFILVDMDFIRSTAQHHKDVWVEFDGAKYKKLYKTRWNPYTDSPIINAAELCFCLRRLVNEDPSRQAALLALVDDHPKVIVFYNYNYELDILKGLAWPDGTVVTEWNGHEHQPIAVESDRWVYLVQYTSGCEGWNCIETDTIIFYSQNYSYTVMKQASGRIDRMNTPFVDLWYYHLKSHSAIDVAISRALEQKRNFNEARFVKW